MSEPTFFLKNYTRVTDHGFCRPCFTRSGGNTIYVARCSTPGDSRGTIERFEEFFPEDPIENIDEALVRTATIGSPWQDVFIWNEKVVAVGTRREIWIATSPLRKNIREEAPLTYFDLASTIPGVDLRPIAMSALSWVRRRFGENRARHWKEHTLLRSALARALRNLISKDPDEWPSELYDIQLNCRDDNSVSIKIPDSLLPPVESFLCRRAEFFEPFNDLAKALGIREFNVEPNTGGTSAQSNAVKVKWRLMLGYLNASLSQTQVDATLTTLRSEARQFLPMQSLKKNAEPRRRELMGLFKEFFAAGDRLGFPHYFEVALAIARLALPMFSDRDQIDDCRDRLASALTRLGEYKGNRQFLKEAIEIYRSAADDGTRKRLPLDWATTQNNLANARMALGLLDGDIGSLESSVSGYRLALEVCTRERAPADWAETMNNLGNALTYLGGRTSQLTLLEEAIEKYRLSLQERTKEKDILLWAMTQDNLTMPLQLIGENTPRIEFLREAVKILRSILHEYESIREEYPVSTADSLDKLAVALSSLAQRERNLSLAEEAVEASSKALQARPREQMPLAWASAQNNLGKARAVLGSLKRDIQELSRAADAFRKSLEVWTFDQSPPGWARAHYNLGFILAQIARLGNTAVMEDALSALRNALKVYNYESFPVEHLDIHAFLENPFKEPIDGEFFLPPQAKGRSVTTGRFLMEKPARMPIHIHLRNS